MSEYSCFDFFNSVARSEANVETADAQEERSFNYMDTLELVRNEISEQHVSELSLALTDSQGAQTLCNLISKELISHGIRPDVGSDEALVQRIYEDMAGLGILTKYIRDPSVEEININSYRQIEIVYGDHTDYLYDDDAFPTPTLAVDIIKKMVRMGGELLDAVTPMVDSYIGGGTRISAMIPPIVPEDVGVSAEIRKQSKKGITKKQLIDSGAAIEPELDFLILCLTHGISVGIAGGTGSGKTTDQGFLLNSYIEENNDWNNRIFIIEDSRETTLKEYDETHDRPARVIYTVTREGKSPITMRDLLKASLRFHPQLDVPLEVRSEEALEAADAGISGHTILTSLHAHGAREAYDRLKVMCMQAGTALSEEALLRMCVAAWPIMVFKKQLRDGTRKYMEIFEATGIKDGEVVGNMLYRFTVGGEDTDLRGNVIKVNGQHERVGTISPKLRHTLLQNGAKKDELWYLFPDADEAKEVTSN